MAVELKNRIAVDLKVNVPVVKFLQGFSVDQAVTQVLDQLTAEAANPSAPLAPAITQQKEHMTRRMRNNCWQTLISFRMRKWIHCSPICWLKRRLVNERDLPANCRSFTR